MIIDVTEQLNRALVGEAKVQDALSLIIKHSFFSRETRSAALGEVTEYLIANIINGERRPRGSKGHDIIDREGWLVEVKSRSPGIWGDSLQFNFGRHTSGADRVYCVMWDDTPNLPRVSEAYEIPISELIKHWSTPNQKTYFARTDIGKIRRRYKQYTQKDAI
jgi:hypothetical protein